MDSRLGMDLLQKPGWMGAPRTSPLHSVAMLRSISLLAFGRGCSEAPITLGLFMPLTLPGLWRGLLTSHVYLENKWPSRPPGKTPSRTGPLLSVPEQD